MIDMRQQLPRVGADPAANRHAERSRLLPGKGIMQHVLEQLVAPPHETTNAKSFAPLRD